MSNKAIMNFKELVRKAKIVGNVYTRGVYGIDEITIICKKDIKLPRGGYVVIEDPNDSSPIVYQIASPYWYKPPFDYEESLITVGSPIKEEHRSRYKCRAILVGKVNEDGEISTPNVPVPPVADVRECPPDLVKYVTEPISDWKIKIGVNPETGNPVYINLEPLVRQGLLIAGAQGSGKTTTLLTLIARAIELSPPLRFLILDWTGEYVSLKEVRENDVCIVNWESFIEPCIKKKPDYIMGLWEDDIRTRSRAVSEALGEALLNCKNVLPTKQNLRNAIDTQSRRYPTTRLIASSVVEDYVPEEFPEGIKESIVNLVQKYLVVIVDFSVTQKAPDEFGLKKKVAAYLAEEIWRKAVESRGKFGCIVISDEAHRICPEKGGFEKIWRTLATEGGRNGCPLWIVARRLSLVSKDITTELQQNFICHNVEDIDRKRVEEDLGTTFAGMLGALPQGEAMVKSAVGFRIPGQTIHVKFEKIVGPASERFRAKTRFEAMKKALSND